MIQMMAEEEGIGLAGPQVGLPWRIFVTNVPESDTRSAEDNPPTAERGPSVYLNPVLSEHSADLLPAEEGCLSLPDIRGVVQRPGTITLSAIDLDGRRFVRTASGLLARCWQHEMDHLDGVLILDRMTQIYRLKNRSAVRDLERDWDDNHPPERRR